MTTREICMLIIAAVFAGLGILGIHAAVDAAYFGPDRAGYQGEK